MINVSENRAAVKILILITLIFSGIRFSDGSMLLAIASGSDVTHPVFSSNPDAQYVFDSPLKVYILRWLPENIIIISLFFLVLAIAPLTVGLLRNLGESQISLALTFLLLTPLMKISLQNVGVGDGLTILLTIFAFISRNFMIATLSIFIACLWHPQQAFFIVVSLLVVDLLREPKISTKSVYICLGAMSALIIYYFYLNTLGFQYAGRSSYMVNNMTSIVRDNIKFFPAFIAPIIAITYLLWPAIMDHPRWKLIVVATYVLIMLFISSLTTDITRVFFITLAPVIIYFLSTTSINIQSRKFWICYAVILASPVVSWSGLDLFLYEDLLNDVCKWGFYCL